KSLTLALLIAGAVVSTIIFKDDKTIQYSIVLALTAAASIAVKLLETVLPAEEMTEEERQEHAHAALRSLKPDGSFFTTPTNPKLLAWLANPRFNVAPLALSFLSLASVLILQSYDG